MNIFKSADFYRAQYITGPSALLVSIQFGLPLPDGPNVIMLPAISKRNFVSRFELKNYVAEVLSGVTHANTKFSGALEVAAIEIVPDDYPGNKHVELAAFHIARAVLLKEV